MQNFINNCLIVSTGGCQAIVLLGLGAWVEGRVEQGCEIITFGDLLGCLGSAERNRVRNFINNCLIVRVGSAKLMFLMGGLGMGVLGPFLGSWVGCRFGTFGRGCGNVYV